MKKITRKYDILQMRNCFKIITILVWILAHAFQWRTIYFVTDIMVGLVCVLAAVADKAEKKRGSAVFWFVLATCWFLLAVRSVFRVFM